MTDLGYLEKMAAGTWVPHTMLGKLSRLIDRVTSPELDPSVIEYSIREDAKIVAEWTAERNLAFEHLELAIRRNGATPALERARARYDKAVGALDFALREQAKTLRKQSESRAGGFYAPYEAGLLRKEIARIENNIEYWDEQAALAQDGTGQSAKWFTDEQRQELAGVARRAAADLRQHLEDLKSGRVSVERSRQGFLREDSRKETA